MVFGRQVVNPEVYDDQSPALLDKFEGNWTRHLHEGFSNNTLTATQTPGASLSFTFRGAWIVHIWLR